MNLKYLFGILLTATSSYAMQSSNQNNSPIRNNQSGENLLQVRGFPERMAEQLRDYNRIAGARFEINERQIGELFAAMTNLLMREENGRRIRTIMYDANLNPRRDLIMENAANVLSMEIIGRYNFLNRLYENKLSKFAPLFSANGLEADLMMLSSYIQQIRVTEVNETEEPNVDVHNVNWWNEPTILEGPYRRMLALHQRLFGTIPSEDNGNWYEYGIVHMSGGHRNRHGWWKLAPIAEAANRVNAELRRRRDAYNASVSRANAIPFPSDSWTRLVEQYNQFLTDSI